MRRFSHSPVFNSHQLLNVSPLFLRKLQAFDKYLSPLWWAEMEKVGDTAIFSAGANFWAILGNFGPFCGIFGQICGKFKFFCGILNPTIPAFRMDDYPLKNIHP